MAMSEDILKAWTKSFVPKDESEIAVIDMMAAESQSRLTAARGEVVAYIEGLQQKLQKAKDAGESEEVLNFYKDEIRYFSLKSRRR